MKFWLRAVLLTAGGVCAAHAAVYEAPAPGDDLIGQPMQIKTKASDTLSALAREYNVGYRAITRANPKVDPWLPGKATPVKLPTQYLLPDAPRNGIVLNLAEMRLYYFPPKGSRYAGKVFTYPVGIGREGWSTPVGNTRVVRTTAHPTWTPPQSIRKEHAEDGDPLPRVVPAGPDNPLGQYALHLALPAYLLHGTNKPAGIGLRVSHGCIRLYPEDIAAMYSMVKPGTPVHIVNQPYKTGWHKGMLYLEAHPPDADGRKRVNNYTPMVQSVIAATRNKPKYPINWNLAQRVGSTARGLPTQIGEAKLARNGQ